MTRKTRPEELEPPRYDSIEEHTDTDPSGTVNALSDGRIAVNLDSKLARAVAQLIDITSDADSTEPLPKYEEQALWTLPMNIVIQVVGSRGDVQPFVALGHELQKSGHRVRIATHNVFKSFVVAAGLEFYPIGGNPAELMAYMVRNPGLIPNMKTLRDGEIQKKRAMIAEMLQGCWRSCIEPDPDSQTPFVANAIIANPPSFAHVHCAQAMSIPLHMVFTMPWSPTRAFPHPLANVQNSSTDPKLANYLSYGLVQMLTWQGLADITNEFRKTIDLPVLPTSEAPFLAETLRIPYTYCWSPSLVPKPRDWADHIDLSGFIFRDPPAYQPPPALVDFLQHGPPPVYIGFGSIVVDEPDMLLATALGAVKETGVRAIISKGWSELNIDDIPSNVFLLGDCPHEWLFQHVAAVVHHGGAGTCAAGLINGRPTTIVPFFGDQPFWGDRVAAAGAGPSPIPHKKLTVENLSGAIRFCLTDQAVQAARSIAENMKHENGVKAAAASFHRQLLVQILRCDIVPNLPAVYELSLKNKTVKISANVAETLIKHDKVKAKQLKLYEPKKYHIENRRWDPLTATAASTARTMVNALTTLNDIWYAPYKMRQKGKAQNNVGADSDSVVSAALPTTTVSAMKATTEDNNNNNNKPVPENEPSIGRLVGESAMFMPKIVGVMAKALMVDVPLAATKGFRNMPKMYGEEVRDHEPVIGVKSGMVLGVKEFGKGIGKGTVDLFYQPYKGAKENGAIGLVGGIGKGMLGSLSKLGSGGLAIYSYPAQGVWQSIYDLTHGNTKKEIFSARRLHDLYFARRDEAEEMQILEAFAKLKET